MRFRLQFDAINIFDTSTREQQMWGQLSQHVPGYAQLPQSLIASLTGHKGWGVISNT